MAHEKSIIESWKLVPLPKITTTSTVGGEPFFPFFPYHSVPKHIKSLPPFVPPISYDNFPTEDPRLQCHLKRTSSAKVYGWNFPPQGSSTQLSDNSSPKPPDEDISALSIDEHAGCSSSSVNIDAGGTMNKTTCDGEFSKPPPPLVMVNLTNPLVKQSNLLLSVTAFHLLLLAVRKGVVLVIAAAAQVLATCVERLNTLLGNVV